MAPRTTGSGVKARVKPYDPESATQRRELATALIAALKKADFLEDQSRPSTEERVYTRGIEKTYARVVVYTTIVHDAVREGGSDAIRVAGVLNDRGVWVNAPVHRTGSIPSIVERTLKRARDTWLGVRSKHRIKENP